MNDAKGGRPRWLSEYSTSQKVLQYIALFGNRRLVDCCVDIGSVIGNVVRMLEKFESHNAAAHNRKNSPRPSGRSRTKHQNSRYECMPLQSFGSSHYGKQASPEDHPSSR